MSQFITMPKRINFSGDTTLSKNIENLPAGPYTARTVRKNKQDGIKLIQSVKFIMAR